MGKFADLTSLESMLKDEKSHLVSRTKIIYGTELNNTNLFSLIHELKNINAFENLKEDQTIFIDENNTITSQTVISFINNNFQNKLEFFQYKVKADCRKRALDLFITSNDKHNSDGSTNREKVSLEYGIDGIRLSYDAKFFPLTKA